MAAEGSATQATSSSAAAPSAPPSQVAAEDAPLAFEATSASAAAPSAPPSQGAAEDAPLAFEDRYPYTAFLKQMELEYLCSGFGYEAVPQMPNGTKPLPAAVLLQHAGTKEEAINDYVGLLQYDRLTVVKDDMDGEAFSVVQITQDIQKRSRSPHKHVDMQGLFMLAASRNMSKSAAVWDSSTHGLGDTTQNMVATGWGNSYPPTLFTKANYKTTCEGAAARELLFSAGETSNLMYLEGTALLVFSLIVTMSRLFLLTCMGRERMEHATVAGPDGKQTKTVVL